MIDPTQQFQIHQQLIHGRVADALAHPERRPVHLIGSALNGRDRVDDAEPPILVTMPVEADLLALFVDNAADETNNFAGAVRSSVTDRVTHTDRARPATNCGGVERANRVGVGSRRVFRNEHYGQAFADGQRDRFFGQLQQLFEGPFFRVETDG